MAELLDILDALTTPLKIAWVVWLAWGIGQVFWYRHERKPRAVSTRPSASPRKPFVSKPSVPDRVVTRLVTPEPGITHQAEPVEHAAEAPAAAGNVAGEVGELDRFVADFEMNTRQRRAQPHNGESYNATPGA
jgi:hypothetical protein